jgi:hypothetical protein
MTGRSVLFLASALLCAPALSAQVPLSLSSEVGLHSAYEGRGLTFTQGPVVQGSVAVGSRIAGLDVFLGAWANFEMFEVRTGRRMLPSGVSGPSEINLYAGASRAVGPLAVEAGAIRFLFPTGFDFSAPEPITELYGTIGADLWLEPAMAAYYDMSARGWYGVASLQRSFPVTAGSGWLRAEVGASHGQADAGEYYGADGVTHAGLSGGVAWSAGALTIEPSVRWIYAVDAAALQPGNRSAVGARNKAVVAFSVSWEI